LKIFETFSYDIIIILVLTVSILSGVYYSLYRQLGNTLVLFVPFLLLYFLFNQIMEVYNRILGNTLFKNAAHRYSLNAVIVYTISFILIGLAVKFIYGLCKPSVQKRVLHQPGKLSRAFGGILGMANGYFLCLILLYFLNPFIRINHESPLTKVLNVTSNRVLTLSKLSQYQFQYSDKYEEYQEVLTLFSGRRALSRYNEIEEFLDVDSTNNNLQTQLLPLLSAQSITLIDTHRSGDDYLRALLTTVDGKLLFTSVLDMEKESSNLSQIQIHYDYLLAHQGYLFAYDQYLLTEELNFENLNGIFQSHLQEIAASFLETEAKSHFLETAKAMNDLQENYLRFAGLLEPGVDTVPAYAHAVQNLLQGNGLNEYAERFVSVENTDPLLKEIFSSYLQNSEKISRLNPNLSLAAKLVLVKEEKNWFADPLWEKQILLKSFLLDALVSEAVAGHQLYQEYFFHCYLIPEYAGNEFTGDDFQTALEKLEDLVSEKLIDENTALGLVRDLIDNPDSPLRSLVLAPAFFEELRTLDHPYLNEASN
jgi:hypothetical protein